LLFDDLLELPFLDAFGGDIELATETRQPDSSRISADRSSLQKRECRAL
jgi:hypothetical protein